jgi:uncharacterized membrane protein HdeD (DUF308 family)
MENKNSANITQSQPWWLLFIEGVFAVILGGVLLWAPSKTQQNTWIILVIVLGFYWLVSGILSLARLAQDQKRWGWKLFTGILSIIAGGYILVYPSASAAAFPAIILLVLGVWGCVHGITRLMAAFYGAGWGSALLGILMLIIGFILIINFANPAYGLALVYFASAAIFIMGFVLIYKAFRHNPKESMAYYW